MIEALYTTKKNRKAHTPYSSWQSAAFNLPIALESGGTSVFNSDLYMFGFKQTGAVSQLYKLQGGIFVPVIDFVRPTYGMRMFKCDQDVDVIGTSGTRKERLKYHTAGGYWSRQIDLLTSSIFQAYCFDAFNFYVAGSNDFVSNHITRIDAVAGNVMQQYTVSNVNRAHMIMGKDKEFIYYGGGYNNVNGFTVYSDFYRYNTLNGTTLQMASMPEAGYCNASYASVNGKLIVCNPMSGTANPLTATYSNKVYSYQYSSNTWISEPDTATGINHSMCFVYDNKFYRVGGRNQTQLFDTGSFLV